jgi:hypothetical protein
MGTTAIAAVLALSSTPLAAQEAPSTETPVVEAPAAEPIPAPVTEPAADSLAPEPVAESSAPAETTAVEAEPAEAAPAAKPVAKLAATKPVRMAERSAPRASASAASAQPEARTEPVTEAPAATPMAAIEASPEVVPAAPEPQQDAQLEEALPVAGGAGALILALAGAGMAVRRRKRREEDEMVLDRQAYAENTDAALQPIEAEEPAPEWSEPVIQPKSAPVIPARMETTEVSDEFDTSRFGRHVQAAYRGPTPENPSLSLRKRLKLAGELDRRERMQGAMPTPSVKPVTASLPADEKPAMSFGGSATQTKWHEYQL